MCVHHGRENKANSWKKQELCRLDDGLFLLVNLLVIFRFSALSEGLWSNCPKCMKNHDK
jgi:hypothetical protein